MKKKNITKKVLEEMIKKYKRALIALSVVVVLLFGFILFTYNHKITILDNKIVIKKIERNKNVEVENNHNASYKLKLISAYGDNDAFHPKVISFENKWNGYKYWMVFSPYPRGNDGKENPHIKVSNDLVNWTEPEGFKNPLVNRPVNYIMGVNYNSDPHLVYNPDTDTLECYYRHVNDSDDKVIIYRLTTKDGVNWSKKEEIITAKRSRKDYLSPAIIYEDGIYKMWSVDKDRKVKYMESKDGYKYENERTIDLKYQLTTLKNWHLDVIHTKNGYEMIVVAYTSWEDRLSMNLYYFKSKDNKNYSEGITILRPSVKSWDNRGIYRSSLMYENDTYYLFYSAMSRTMERGVGLSYGKEINNLNGLSGDSIND